MIATVFRGTFLPAIIAVGFSIIASPASAEDRWCVCHASWGGFTKACISADCSFSRDHPRHMMITYPFKVPSQKYCGTDSVRSPAAKQFYSFAERKGLSVQIHRCSSRASEDDANFWFDFLANPPETPPEPTQLKLVVFKPKG